MRRERKESYGGRQQSSDELRQDLVDFRKRQTEALIARGLVRTGANDEPQRLPILAFTGRVDDDAAEHFLAINGRILVPNDQVERLRELLGDALGERIDLGNERIAAFELRGVDVVVALDRLAEAAPELRVSPQHLVFPAYRSKGQEGEDPEPVDPSIVGSPPTGDLPGTGVKVAVVDTGVAEAALEDPWLAGIVAARNDLDELRVRETRLDPRDKAPFQDLEAGHGTMVIAVVRTVAPGCEIEVIRALDPDGNATDDEVARGIDEAVARGADIINLSLGGLTNRDLPPLVIEDAIRRVPPEVLLVAAAGNFFTARPSWPGAIRRVVSVAALEQVGNDHGGVVPELAWYSSFGWWVDLAAPGEWSTTFITGRENPEREQQGAPDQFEGYARAAGTSLAAAAVSGALAVELEGLRRGTKSDAAAVSARDAMGALLARRANVRLPQGTIAVDVWDGK
jgi:subtilisin family serine protease